MISRKINPLLPRRFRLLTYFMILTWAVTGTQSYLGQTQSTNATIAIDEGVAIALKELDKNPGAFWLFRDKLRSAAVGREQAIQTLIDMLNDPKSRNITKRYAAYYLGLIRGDRAVDVLAAQINLEPDGIIGGSLGEAESEWNSQPAASALIEIGTPSIPALIRNLTESDDVKVRETSLWVLCCIEDDKDIVHLRLQKALTAETDPGKQGRLRIALTTLSVFKYPYKK